MKNKNTSGLALALLFLFVMACGCPKTDERRSENSTTSTRTPSMKTLAFVSPSPTVLPSVLPTAVTAKSSVKKALIISENADLRTTPDSAGELVETLPQDESVEVVKQKGAWFYIKTDSTSGWVHGNAIRLVNDSTATTEDSDSPLPRYPSRSSTPKPRSETTSPSDVGNPSGATARCADGTLSYSAHRRGTCSHHGGVAIWY